MSKYSGKCDFADLIDIYGDDKIFNNFEIYLQLKKNSTLLKFGGKSDMIPFFPHIVTGMGSSDGCGAAFLSQYPYPYEKDRDYWNVTVARFKRELAYQRKRSKETFNLKEFTIDFIRNWSSSRDNDEQLWNVCNQILEGKKKLKFPLLNGTKWYMQCLCDEMAKFDIEPARFGYIVKNGKVADYDKKALERQFNRKENKW